MKLSRQEEYGLRCMLQLVRLAPEPSNPPVSTEQISEHEGLGYEHTAKIMRLLRHGGLVESTRGASGGFTLARDASEISVWDILMALDQPLYGDHFCESFSGRGSNCVHTNACNLRGLWSWVNSALEQTLSGLSLADLAEGQTWPQAPASPSMELS